ncbi:hypothetical protein [Agrobacterium tumefaciens]|uniref:hypothetical protein n=1 Tax=Agrobacterium tumefaciens TaxID=358 RepID=UPI0012D2C29E|nr:hypothetical protein [Agrobacterium tumefaciens]
MSDNSSARLDGDTPEQVAFKLLVLVGTTENKMHSDGRIQSGADRQWILDTYAECLEATKGNRSFKSK